MNLYRTRQAMPALSGGQIAPAPSMKCAQSGCTRVAVPCVPVQCWPQKTYDAAAALKRGTLFPELDLPFMGKGGVK